MTTTFKKPLNSRKRLWLVLAAIVVLAGAGVAFALNQNDDKQQPGTSTAGQETKGEAGTDTSGKDSDNSSTTDSSEPGDQKSESGGTSSLTLLEPIGNFVSNHHPAENGSPSTETSVCTTTPGATCAITFTKDGVTKSLDAQTTDRGGSTYWNNWTPTSIGLTSGSWKIQAVVKLDGNTKTANDATELVVQ